MQLDQRAAFVFISSEHISIKNLVCFLNKTKTYSTDKISQFTEKFQKFAHCIKKNGSYLDQANFALKTKCC